MNIKTLVRILSRAKNKGSIGLVLAGISLGVAYEEMVGIGTWHSIRQNTGEINVCFTPPAGCGSLIAQQIKDAKHSIFMQAYSLTSIPIITGLVKAKSRGLTVRVILDRSHLSEEMDALNTLTKAGIEVIIDKMAGIAHNKVIVIDKRKVITGSFNFTKAADYRNAENLLLIENKKIAEIYLKNWQKRAMANEKRS